jgi:hypothetical protein
MLASDVLPSASALSSCVTVPNLVVGHLRIQTRILAFKQYMLRDIYEKIFTQRLDLSYDVEHYRSPCCLAF